MKYQIKKNKIVITKHEDFCPEHILECGQIFSYVKNEQGYIVYSADKMAKILKVDFGYEIVTKDVNYFEIFFDLNTNYGAIKEKLSKNFNFLNKGLKFGHGIRILNQDHFETIISFIISANNNIKRIQKILFEIRQKFGKNMGEYYAFPTINELKKASIQDFKNMGAGYRAEYLYKAVRQLENKNIIEWQNLETNKLQEQLLNIMGVGPKVADCIMLFAYGKKDVFPVDTWIEKVYNQYFKKETNRNKIRQSLLKTFGEFSGYAQQYLFYSQRSDIGS